MNCIKSRARRLSCIGWMCLVFLLISPVMTATPSRTLPPFRIKLLDGTVLQNKHLKGRVTIIDFWAVWCGPCIAEIGEYNRFYTEYKNKGVKFVGLASDSGTEDEVRGAVKRLKIGYPIAAPSPKELDAFGDVSVLPTTWIIDARGKVQKEFLGVPPGKHRTLRAIVDGLLKEGGK